VKTIAFFLAAALLVPSVAKSAESQPCAFYVQLLRGSDDDAPPAPQAHLIGTELGQRLHRVFRWKNYWELNRQTVSLTAGKTVRTRMNSRHEVELSLSKPDELMVCVYSDGQLVRKRHQAIETRFYITGGDNDGAESWFIVVRRDKPQDVAAAQAHDLSFQPNLP
jgi:hypothetical protein